MAAAIINTITMSQTEYATHKGVSKQAIGKLVKRGIIPLLADGRIDPQIADLKLSTHLNPARAKSLAGKATPPAIAEPVISPTPAQAPTVGSPGSNVVDINTYAGAKAIRERIEAQRAQLEYDQLLGTMVDKAGVRRAAMDIARPLRDAILGIGVRIGPSLVGLDAAEIVHRLEEEHRKVLLDVSKKLAGLLSESKG